MKYKNIVGLTLSCISLTFSARCFAWGALGHRTVGVIADAGLTAKSQAAVQKLLGTETLGDVANWADSLKSTDGYHQAVWYHFEKISDDVSYIKNLQTMPDWQKKKGGIVAAILVASEILRSPTATPAEQTDALKFLVHFVGDIHQPLHTGRPEDKGGVTLDTTWFGVDMSLHRIWDSGMLYTGHKDIVNEKQTLTEQAAAYAKYLTAQQSRDGINLNMDAEGWLNESLALRTAAYDPLFKTDQPAYQNLHMKEIDRRIFTAGLRLAALINSIYAGETVPAPEMDLKKSIEAVVGDIHSVISFQK